MEGIKASHTSRREKGIFKVGHSGDKEKRRGCVASHLRWENNAVGKQHNNVS